jgi:5'(3')-deoxyribonucleotidase
MDGVIANLHTEWILRYNDKTGSDLKYTDIKTWKITEYMPKLSTGEAVAIVQDPDIYHYVDPIPGAVEMFQLLRARGYECLVASHVYPGMMLPKYNWLMHHGFLQSANEFMCIPSIRKPLLRSSALIEDNLHTASAHERGIVYNQRWNVKAQGILPVIMDWHDQEKALATIEQAVHWSAIGY